MKALLLPLATALLFLPACSCHKRACARRCNPPAATQCCPQAKPGHSSCGCKKEAPRRRVGSNRHPVSLSEVMNYLPGVPPHYVTI